MVGGIGLRDLTLSFEKSDSNMHEATYSNMFRCTGAPARSANNYALTMKKTRDSTSTYPAADRHLSIHRFCPARMGYPQVWVTTTRTSLKPSNRWPE